MNELKLWIISFALAFTLISMSSMWQLHFFNSYFLTACNCILFWEMVAHLISLLISRTLFLSLMCNHFFRKTQAHCLFCIVLQLRWGGKSLPWNLFVCIEAADLMDILTIIIQSNFASTSCVIVNKEGSVILLNCNLFFGVLDLPCHSSHYLCFEIIVHPIWLTE